MFNENKTGNVLTEVLQERKRQEELLAQGKFAYTCASSKISNSSKLPVLGEEFGEVCKEVTEMISLVSNAGCGSVDLSHSFEYRKQNLRKELIQVAAVAVAWAESIEKDENPGG